MSVKQMIKRTIKWIVKGTPVVNVDVNVGMINWGGVLEGKTVIITGGGRGLGFAIAKKCVEQGATVIIAGRNESTLKEASQKLQGCLYEVLDISSMSSVNQFLDRIFNKYNHIDYLVNNAGISLHEKNILDVSEGAWDNQFNTNLKGAYFLTQAFIANNKTDCGILFVSSERGMQCDDVPYGLTKAALNSLTKGLSRRWYDKGIRVNAIAPGITTSDMTGKKADENLYCASIASKRYFIPEEVAEVAVFLLSDASKCISGEIIHCDAGNYISSYY